MGNRPYTWTGHEETHEYDDIIDLPHYVSETRPHMSPLDRAAQFAPYDALNGYSEEITETARRTDAREELDDTEMEILSEKIAILDDLCDETAHGRFVSAAEGREDVPALPVVTVTYFVPDYRMNRRSKKTGGAYLTHTGAVRRVDVVERMLAFDKNSSGETLAVAIADISSITGTAVDGFDDRDIP